MPGKGDEMTIWTEEGRKRVWKYFVTMYLKEAYALYLESCEKDDDKRSFSTFCNFSLKNVLLLDESPKQQCKCQIHENLFLKLHEKDWWNTMLCNSTPNSNCWKNMCKECIDGKKLSLPKLNICGLLQKMGDGRSPISFKRYRNIQENLHNH